MPIYLPSSEFLEKRYKKRKQDEKIFKNHFYIGDLQWFRRLSATLIYETEVQMLGSKEKVGW